MANNRFSKALVTLAIGALVATGGVTTANAAPVAPEASVSAINTVTPAAAKKAKQYRYVQKTGSYYSSATSKKSLGTIKRGAKYEYKKWDSKNRRDQIKVNGRWVWTNTTGKKKPATSYRYVQKTSSYYSSASKSNKKSLGTVKRGTKVEWRTWDSKNRRDEVKINGKWVWSDQTNPRVPAKSYRYAKKDGAYYKTQSKKDTKSLGNLKKGTKVEWRTWDSSNRRDEVKVNGKWVWSDKTGPNNPNPAPKPPAKPKPPVTQDKNITDYGTFSTATLNIRKGPGTNHATAGKIPEGNKVTVTHNTNVSGWVKIKHGSTVGYVSSKYLNKTGKYSVAVYGTLRTGQSAYGVMGKFQQKNLNQRITKASLYQLWNKNWTFLTNGPKTVVAEQFQYGPGNGASMLKKLDIYEGQLKYQGKPMYSRQRVTMGDGSISWGYKTTPTGEKVAKASGKLISSGDFLKRS